MPELVCAADSPDWLTERRKGITATDITAITGLSPYESAYSLFFKKRGDIPDEHQDNPRLALGRYLEDYERNHWMQANPTMSVYDGGLWRSTARPWQLATPDYLAGDRDQEDPPWHNSVLEVKSWADADRDRWHDGPPARVRAQVLWQMDTLDVATGHVGVLFLPSGEFRSYEIRHANEDKCWEMVHPAWCLACDDIALLRSAGRDFMDRLDTNDPPAPDGSLSSYAALKARFTDIHHDKTAEIDQYVWSAYEGDKELAKAHEEAAREWENLIREQAGEARTLTVNGEKVATHVNSTHTVAAHDAYERTLDYIRPIRSKGETSE